MDKADTVLDKIRVILNNKESMQANLRNLETYVYAVTAAAEQNTTI